MIIALDLILFAILILTAILALKARDQLTSVALLSGYSLFAAMLFAGMLALDVALVEAALGAGLTGVLFVTAVLATARKTDPRPGSRRQWLAVPIIVLFLGVMLYASSDLPDRGDPDSASQQGVSRAYIEGSMDQTQTPNVVTSLLADYRSMDTLGETTVILTAALSAALVLTRRQRTTTTPSAGLNLGVGEYTPKKDAPGSAQAHRADDVQPSDDPKDPS